jgi:hypothetical protein
MSNLAIGFRAKTGKAIVVILGGPPDSPIVLFKTEIKLIDPKVPATRQPYHEVMDLPWSQSQQAVAKSLRAIEQVATKTLARLITDEVGPSHMIAGVGVVGAPDRDLARIGNPHIRAHAAEGVLFRRVLETAATANGLKWQSFPDRDFDQAAAGRLSTNYSIVKQRLNDLRQSVPAPWRTDEKQAAMAAWIVLHQ